MTAFLRSSILHFILALLIGLGLGLAYSWFISPVTYVDANPTLLRSDFKDQYRIVIASAYASNQDLARARARLSLLGDINPVDELTAQAQRMLAAGESFENARPLAQLATDLQQGFVNQPFTPTAFPTFNTPDVPLEATATESFSEQAEATEDIAPTSLPTLLFEQTPFTPSIQETQPARATFTPTAGFNTPYLLVGQEPICEPGAPLLLQFMFTDSRRNQIPGVEIIVTWNQGEDRFFTGFKSELGLGYADFLMQANTIYNVRVVTGGAYVADITPPKCTDPNGSVYSGGVALTFQQP